MGSVFISYRSSDRSFVTHLAEDLRENGFDVWLDQWQISGRLPYWEEIQGAVERCTHFVFIISPDSIQRDSGSMTELLHAIQLRPAKVIVPIICKPTPFSSIPMVIGPGKLQIHDFTKIPYDEGLQRAIHALRSELPTPASDTQKAMSPVPPPPTSVSASDNNRSSGISSRRTLLAVSLVIGVLVVLGGAIFLNGLRTTSSTQTPPALTPTTDSRAEQILTATFEAQTKLAQASLPTATLTATPTATATSTVTKIDPNDYVNQTFAARTEQAAKTIAAYTKTPTSTNTSTPNYQQTAAAIVAATDAKATANVIASYTKTPTPTVTRTFTPTYTPSNTLTPSSTATPTSTSTFTSTPSLTPTPTLTPYPTLDETQNPTTWKPIIRKFDYNGYSVEMVLVPAGSFTMGSDTSNQQDERPAQQQEIAQPFWLDRYEVTNEQFDKLKGEAANKGHWTEAQRPREQISWIEAQQFCEEKRGGFLPTEAQWEWSARGPQNLTYPWGNEWDDTKLVLSRSSNEGTAPVGSKIGGQSWIGALDMSGNVTEWTSSLYANYPYHVDDTHEDKNNNYDPHVLRGGSWISKGAPSFRSMFRYKGDPKYGYSYYGFRCARSFTTATIIAATDAKATANVIASYTKTLTPTPTRIRIDVPTGTPRATLKSTTTPINGSIDNTTSGEVTTETAAITDVATKWNVHLGNEVGLQIKTTFTIDGYKGKKLLVAVLFYDMENHELKSADETYSINDQIGTGITINAKSGQTEFKDVTLFVADSAFANVTDKEVMFVVGAIDVTDDSNPKLVGKSELITVTLSNN